MKYSGKGKTRSENVSEHDKHYRIFSLRVKEITIHPVIDSIDDPVAYVESLLNFATQRLVYYLHLTSHVGFIIKDSKGRSFHIPWKLCIYLNPQHVSNAMENPHNQVKSSC